MHNTSTFIFYSVTIIIFILIGDTVTIIVIIIYNILFWNMNRLRYRPSSSIPSLSSSSSSASFSPSPSESKYSEIHKQFFQGISATKSFLSRALLTYFFLFPESMSWITGFLEANKAISPSWNLIFSLTEFWHSNSLSLCVSHVFSKNV